MTLRARLVLWLTSLLTVLVVLLGAVIVQTNRAVLIGQIDDELRAYVDRSGSLIRRGRPPGFGFLPDQQTVALIRFDDTGTVVGAAPSGFADSPDPLPDTSVVQPPADQPYLVNLRAIDGSIRYRALVFEAVENTTSVIAVPLEDVEASISAILRSTLLAAAVVIITGGAATWFLVTRGLRPVEEMVGTAQEIASGNLTSRVEDIDASTELGRLGGALNDMLAQIESAFSTEREAQDRLQQFVADASHELRTPLTTIAGYMELYEKGALEGEELDRVVSRIRRETARMRRLVEDMLLLARLDQDPAGVTRTFDLMGVVGDAVNDHEAVDGTRPITVVGPESVPMCAEEHRVAQVVANLVNNARVHTPEGTTITIEVTADEDMVTLVIADDGPGLDQDQIPHLFDRFYRTDRSRARATGGSGLGLAIVAAIVETHGGSVSAGSRDGGGARFEVRLPLTSSQPMEAA